MAEQYPPPGSFVPFRRDDIEQSIPDRFRSRVALAPGDIAIRTFTSDLSYAQLDTWSDVIAGELLSRLDVRVEPVPFLLAQGPTAIATTLGILKAGKHYVPIDPSWGLERAIELVDGLNAQVIVAEAEFATPLRERFGETVVLELSPECPTVVGSPIRIEITPDQPAYIYFTSGSTGRPKGVIDCHRNVLHNVMRYTNALSIGKSDRLSLLQSCGFSGAVSSMFAALLNGATSCPVDMRAENPSSLVKWMDELCVTIYHSVPSIFRSMMSAAELFHKARVVRLEGDRATRLDLELFRTHFRPPSVLAIGLGTTETGLVSQYFFEHDSKMPEGVVPIGYSAEDMQVEICGEHGKPIADGTAGEIIVKSRFLAIGYWNDPLATSRAFEDAEGGSGERTYRTGDLGRINDEGCLEHLGRLDGRARIRGQWIDLADVETALCALPGVREAAVSVLGEQTGHARLVGYYVTTAKSSLTISKIRLELSSRLPASMVPARFIELEKLPLTANGKVDRSALPAPEPVRPNLSSRMVAPVDPVQMRLCALWEELLNLAPIGVRDDFFDLGGDSLLAMSMLSRVERISGRTIPASVLLDGATIGRLASALTTDSGDGEGPVVWIRQKGNRPPFFFLHGDYISGGFYCRELARGLSPEQPFLALPPCGLDGGPIPSDYRAMAERHLDAIKAIQPHGPYLLGGECNGGLVAYEIARRLEADGDRVALLALLSASAANLRLARFSSVFQVVGKLLRISPATLNYATRRVLEFVTNQSKASTSGLLRALVEKRAVIAAELGRLVKAHNTAGGEAPGPKACGPEYYRKRLRDIYRQIDHSYLPGRYGGRVTLIYGREESPDVLAERAWWRTVAPEIETFTVPGGRRTKLTRYMEPLASVLDGLLERSLREFPIQGEAN